MIMLLVYGRTIIAIMICFSSSVFFFVQSTSGEFVRAVVMSCDDAIMKMTMETGKIDDGLFSVILDELGEANYVPFSSIRSDDFLY